jgi:hypothetical protein
MFDSLKCCNLHDLLFSETGGERVRGGGGMMKEQVYGSLMGCSSHGSGSSRWLMLCSA